MHGHGICFEEASESCHLGLAQNRKHQQVIFRGAALGEGFCFFRKCFDGSKSGILAWCSLAVYDRWSIVISCCCTYRRWCRVLGPRRPKDNESGRPRHITTWWDVWGGCMASAESHALVTRPLCVSEKMGTVRGGHCGGGTKRDKGMTQQDSCVFLELDCLAGLDLVGFPILET